MKRWLIILIVILAILIIGIILSRTIYKVPIGKVDCPKIKTLNCMPSPDINNSEERMNYCNFIDRYCPDIEVVY